MSVSNYIATGVYDGDSFTHDFVGKGYFEFRIAGIDCPDAKSPWCVESQPFSKEAEDFLRTTIKGKMVTVKSFGVDQFDRNIVQVFVEVDGVLVDVAEMLLERGLAWYLYPNKLDKETRLKYRTVRNKAKKQKVGLWGDPFSISPAKWRLLFNPNNFKLINSVTDIVI